ncbi:hypothetical protein KAR26_02410 [Candidatus Parcubacteria bacterium]|nr:hypothetical protein [Candidatus Parcubacteria bacterium]
MTDTELIQKIRKLKQIKPREEWVVLTKNKMFDIKDEVIENTAEQTTEAKTGIKEILIGAFKMLNYRPAMAATVSFAFLFVLFVSAQNSLPGDSLFSIKKITEQVRIELASQTEKPKVQLELAEKRLTELAKIADANLGKNLASAIEEFEKTAKKSARALKEMSAVDDYKIDKEIVAVIEAIEEKTKNIEKTLAVQIDTSAFTESADSYYRICQLEVEQQITDFENSTLTVEQEGLLQTAKQHYKEGDCNQALEVIFILSNPEE